MRTLAFIPLLAFLAVCSAQKHDLSLGQNSYGDVILYKVDDYRYAIPFMTRTSTIEYPLPGQGNYATIRAIYVQDHDKDGEGGYPTIEAGGIGQKFVNIKLKSQRGYGFNFTITIYGRY